MADVNLFTEMERFREKLLDLSMRNPLLNYRKSTRRTLQIVDELPEVIFQRLVGDGRTFAFDAIPEPPEEPQPDEENTGDQNPTANANTPSKSDENDSSKRDSKSEKEDEPDTDPESNFLGEVSSAPETQTPRASRTPTRRTSKPSTPL